MIFKLCYIVFLLFNPISLLALEKQKEEKGPKPSDKKMEKSLLQQHPKQFDITLKVDKYELENGMTVLLHKDRRIPYVYHQLWVKVGSVDEKKGKTGLAHLFEHMMFRGTAKYTGDEYEKKLESIGARNNAFTSRDYTAYHVVFPSQYLDMVLNMEAERFQSLKITHSNFTQEREVVKEERRMRVDNEPNDFFEPLMKLVFESNPYGRPILGWMKDLEKEDVKDCKKFYNKYYVPNNMVLVLVGDFDAKKAKKLIEKYYGPLKKSSTLANEKALAFKNPKQKKERILRLKRNISAPTLAIAYQGPKSGSPASYSLDILSDILTRGESSRLYRLLVYKKALALSVGGSYYGLKKSGVFLVFVTLAPKASVKKVRALIEQEIKNIQTSGVKKREMLKSLRATMNNYVDSLKDMSGRANNLGMNEALFSDYSVFFKDFIRYQKVSAQDVKEQARKVLLPSRSSVVELIPLNDRS